MNTRYSSGKVPIELIEQLRNSLGSHRFRRRAVLASGNGQWELVCCTVEGFLPGENIPESVTSRKYPQAVLYEDLLTADECVCFAEELQNGRVQFDDIELQPKQNSQWTTELVSVNNDYMARAGHVIGMRFSQNGTQAYVTTLLAPGKPYYPDIHDAARDWLPFRTYHGHSDGRNGQIFFLLPETRAFIARAAFSEKGTLEITIEGTDVSL